MLLQSRDGDPGPLDALFPLVYDELSRIAHRQLGRFRPGETLNTSALVHDAYLRSVDQTQANWHDRGHFFATAARAMRFIIVDHARSDRPRSAAAAPRSSGSTRSTCRSRSRRACSSASTRRSRASPPSTRGMARIVELRFFGGLTEVETAEALALSDRTVRREWLKAKAWLHLELST
jgi:RNA polymerase sigma factor (TIGR02999 family)